MVTQRHVQVRCHARPAQLTIDQGNFPLLLAWVRLAAAVMQAMAVPACQSLSPSSPRLSSVTIKLIIFTLPFSHTLGEREEKETETISLTKEVHFSRCNISHDHHYSFLSSQRPLVRLLSWENVRDISFNIFSLSLFFRYRYPFRKRYWNPHHTGIVCPLCMSHSSLFPGLL